MADSGCQKKAHKWEHMHRLSTHKTCLSLFSTLPASNHRIPGRSAPDATVLHKTMEYEGVRARSAHRKEGKLVAAEGFAQLKANVRPRRPLEKDEMPPFQKQTKRQEEISIGAQLAITSRRVMSKRIATHQIIRKNLDQENMKLISYKKEERQRRKNAGCASFCCNGQQRHAKAEVVGAR